MVWFIVIVFAAIGMFACTWKCGEWLTRRNARRFDARRESWRELEIEWPQQRDRPER